MKLNSDEVIELRDVITADGIKGLVKEMYIIVNRMEQAFLRLDTQNPNVSSDTLMVEKARIEGAHYLATAVETRIEQVKKERLEA